jgi:acetyltransferase-like isoleucine patch superfamily enzyme
MTILTLIAELFPLSALTLIIGLLYNFVTNPTLLTLIYFILAIYLYPLLAYRLHNIIFPLKEGVYNLALKKYNPWWGSYKIQQIYYHLPFLESLLIMCPGLYSLWLRAWGSKIGKNIVWTPNIQITDRSLMIIGDNVVFGHQAQFISHVITPKKNEIALYIKKILIGQNSFIGAASRFGPGVTIHENTSIRILTVGLPNQEFCPKETTTDSNRNKD